MEKPRKKVRDRYTKIKEKAIYWHYHKVIKRHGKYAGLMKLHDLYEETALPFFMSGYNVGKIIRKIMHEKRVHRMAIQNEYEENVEEANEARLIAEYEILKEAAVNAEENKHS
jgi:hypothetical protein